MAISPEAAASFSADEIQKLKQLEEEIDKMLARD